MPANVDAMRRLLLIIVLASAAVARADPPVVVTTFDCAGADGSIAAMENSHAVSLGGPCWAHLGHHTYDAGRIHAVGHMSGRVFSVEIQFSPPTEYIIRPEAPPVPPIPLPPAPLFAALAVEGSTDGIAWDLLGHVPYRMTSGTRQEILFSFDAGGVHARYLRIRQPRSAAQGLSGYLDASHIEAELTPVAPAPTTTVAGSQSYRCGLHAFERFFIDHPCWFGGINRYDAPSFLHTYRVGDTSVIYAVHGVVTILPWRTDDYSDEGGSTTDVGFDVQVSLDGQTWSTIGSARVPYGDSRPFAFDDLVGVTATYVRIVPEPHTAFSEDPALKHSRGFLVDSSIAVAGDELIPA